MRDSIEEIQKETERVNAEAELAVAKVNHDYAGKAEAHESQARVFEAHAREIEAMVQKEMVRELKEAEIRALIERLKMKPESVSGFKEEWTRLILERQSGLRELAETMRNQGIPEAAIRQSALDFERVFTAKLKALAYNFGRQGSVAASGGPRTV